MNSRVSIQTEDFDLSAEVARLRAGVKGVGAVCTFVGTVRDRNDGQSVSTMELELALSQLHMHTRVQAIQQELNPARQALGVVKDVFARPRKGLLYVGVGIGVDLLLRRRLLKKAGWLPRLVVPFLVQNAAANVIHRNSTSFLEKGLRWFKKATAKR